MEARRADLERTLEDLTARAEALAGVCGPRPGR